MVQTKTSLLIRKKTTHYGNILYYQSKSAFICSDIYADYLQKVVFLYINDRRAEINKPDLRAIIIADGHKSHVSELAKALCASNNIEYLVIPPHSSHILQPLDLCFFSLVKSNYRNLKEDFGFSSFTNKIERIFVSVQKAQVTSFILHSWRKAGIDPILLNGEVNQVILRPEIVENGFFFVMEQIGQTEYKKIDVCEGKKNKRTPAINIDWGYINKKEVTLQKNMICPLCKSKINHEKN